ncbi:MAG: peptidoglycan domain protein [Bacteroidales bacterium]|jgi:lysozyme family protein|nr:peptidoglycan domain protein [Bacteroidales bacterium]
MARIEILAEKLFRWEGRFVDNPADKGGATNRGVTIATWQSMGFDKDGDGDIDREDIRLLSQDDCLEVLRHFYWDRWRADEIKNQAIANMLVDWLWLSGMWGIIIPQRLLQVADDGIAGPVTITTLNRVNPGEFLIRVYKARLAFIRNIIRNDPSQKVFEKGWINRLNDFI